MAFRGTFDFTLDDKNRLTVPAKFRNDLGDRVVLAKGIERCVAVWSPVDFEGYVASATAQFPPLSTQAEKFERYFLANSIDIDIDKAGRVMVPTFLLEHARLDKEVVITGAGQRLEVWDRATWADYNAELAADVSDIRERLGHTAP